jgi:AIR synthase-related protein
MSSQDLGAMVQHLSASPVFRGKQSIKSISQSLPHEHHGIRNGDDAAAVPDGDGFLLFAAEGIVPTMVSDDPYLAGRCAVLANINDIYAMGGRPVAMVDVIGAAEQATAESICRGMRDNAARFGVPVVGGHVLRVGSGPDSLAAAILGRARKLITSFDARPGDVLLLVTGSRGRWLGDYGFWNCTLEEDDKDLVPNLELLPRASELGLVEAGKDVSMGGIAGTAVMLAETSGVGMRLDVDSIEPPNGVEKVPWMLAFLSYGFLLSVHPLKLEKLRNMFLQNNLRADTIGSVLTGSEVVLARDDQEVLLWDWKAAPLTGFGQS